MHLPELCMFFHVSLMIFMYVQVFLTDKMAAYDFGEPSWGSEILQQPSERHKPY